MSRDQDIAQIEQRLGGEPALEGVCGAATARRT